jgi:TrmH family RNA methyltransferase
MVEEINSVSPEDLKRISSFKTPNNALAVVQMNDSEINFNPDPEGLYLALDSVQDPGNLGTIIRTAAWFGIKYIICSPECADRYNPKVIQSSMGAIIHTKVVYQSLSDFLTSALKTGLPVYGTLLEGKSIYSSDLSDNGVILLGNESKGISQNLIPFITERIMIPKKTTQSYGIDSLNVSMAAAIICSEFARHSSGR